MHHDQLRLILHDDVSLGHRENHRAAFRRALEGEVHIEIRVTPGRSCVVRGAVAMIGIRADVLDGRCSTDACVPCQVLRGRHAVFANGEDLDGRSDFLLLGHQRYGEIGTQREVTQLLFNETRRASHELSGEGRDGLEEAVVDLLGESPVQRAEVGKLVIRQCICSSSEAPRREVTKMPGSEITTHREREVGLVAADRSVINTETQATDSRCLRRRVCSLGRSAPRRTAARGTSCGTA